MVSRAIGVVRLKFTIRTYIESTLAFAHFQLRLKPFIALSFVNVKALWLAVENSAAVLQSSLLATHPNKRLNRGALNQYSTYY
jgi:hypothetical protein